MRKICLRKKVFSFFQPFLMFFSLCVYIFPQFGIDIVKRVKAADSVQILVNQPCHLQDNAFGLRTDGEYNINVNRAHYNNNEQLDYNFGALDLGLGSPNPNNGYQTCQDDQAISPFNGYIEYIRYDDNCGRNIKIKDSITGLSVLYCHLQEGSVIASEGQSVTIGQKVATIGNTGKVTNGFRHIHFQVMNGSTMLKYSEWKFKAPCDAAHNCISGALEVNNEYVSAENAGNSYVEANRTSVGNWEKFNIIALDNNYVALQTPRGHFFSADNAGGGTVTADRSWIKDWEKFKMHLDDYNVIADVNQISSQERLEFVYKSGWELDAKSTTIEPDGSSLFEISDAGNGQSTIRSYNGPLWQRSGNSNVKAISFHVGDWEKFQIINLGNGKVAIKGSNGLYLSANNGGGSNVTIDRSSKGGWEEFEMIEHNTGSVSFKTANGHYLTIKPGKISLKTIYNTYLQAYNGGGYGLYATGLKLGTWEEFTMKGVDEGFDAINLITTNGNYLSAKNAGGDVITADKTVAQEWEKFYITDFHDHSFALLTANYSNFVSPKQGTVSFETYNGHFLSLENDLNYTVNAKATSKGTNEKWHLYSTNYEGNSINPIIKILEPDGNSDIADVNYTIEWDDFDPDSSNGAKINLYYDTDMYGINGTLIKDNLNAQDILNSYTWDTTKIPDGQYYIYGVINDGKSKSYFSYGNMLTISHNNPVAIDGLKVWLDASDINYNNGDPVVIWPDRSGNENNAEQYDILRAPKYLSTSELGKPVVQFNSSVLTGQLTENLSNDNLTVIFIAKGQEGKRQTVLGLINPQETNYTKTYLNFEVGLWEDVNPDTLAVFRGNGTSYTQSFFNTGDYAGYNKYVVKSCGTSINARFNSTNITTKQSTNILNQNKYILGARSNFNYLYGEIAEIVIYNRCLSDQEIQSIENYYKTKYGI